MKAHAISTRVRAAVLALCAAQFMLILDVVIITVAIPSMRADLAIPDTRLQLVGIAYTLTFGSLLVLSGRIGDLLGRRRVLLAGLVVFTLASLVTGVAQQDWQLLAGRAMQGLGAALMSPNALALITSRLAEGPERNWALGLWAAVGSAGAIAGQLIGGVVTEFLGWRWIFFINVPIGVCVAIIAARTLHESRRNDRPRIDVAGALLLTAGLASLIIALSSIAEDSAGSLVTALLAAAVLLLAGFVAVERRHSTPILRLGLLRIPGVRTGNMTLVLNAGALTATLFFTTLYMQAVLGYSALAVGAAFAPITLIILLVSPYAGRLTGRIGVRRLLLAGLGLLALGMLLLARIPVDGNYWIDVLPGLLLLAFGSGLAYAPTFIAAASGVEPNEQGTASGLINSAQELGAAVGLAILALIAAAATGAIQAATATQLADGYRVGFACAAGFIVLAMIVAWFTPRTLGIGNATDAP